MMKKTDLKTRIPVSTIIRDTFLVMGVFIFISCNLNNKGRTVDVAEAVGFSGEQIKLLIASTEHLIAIGDSIDNRGRMMVSPRSLDEKGNLHLVASPDWCSGFFAGNLWYLFHLTGDTAWKEAAVKYMLPLEKEKFNGGTHDMGFKMMCSFGNGLKYTGNPAYRDILMQSAKTLITRFHPVAGVIRSWDHNRDKWKYPVIIDNMMNLELLYWASKESGDPVYGEIATKHALTTMANHFRSDYSSYHVVDYDTASGKPIVKQTHQGLKDESSWARGQAWGLYGYTMAFRETGNEAFLRQAEKIAEFILNHPRLPEELIPLWDFDAPEKDPVDVSAAAIIASALYELGKYIPSNTTLYTEKADQIMNTLFRKYRSEKGENQGFILGHSVGSKPSGSEVDVPIVYADYYFLEALSRKKELTIKQ